MSTKAILWCKIKTSALCLTSAHRRCFWPALPPGGAWLLRLPTLLRSHSETLQQQPEGRR